MAEDGNITIIKKKKNVVGGGHHGGAWKVAYADFVTAMMAFFLLMWLLNATTEKQRKGLADYFNPTIPIHQTSGGANGPFDGESMMTQDVMQNDGRGATDSSPTPEEEAEGETGLAADPAASADADQEGSFNSDILTPEEDEFELLEGMLAANSGESTEEDPLMAHIRTKVTDEGLIIELVDRAEAPLFKTGSDTPTALFEDLMRVIAAVSLEVTNGMAIAGHSFSAGLEGDDNVDWQLSSNRAQMTRRMMTGYGVPGERFARVTGKANRKPAFRDRTDIRNNRIEIILLR